MQSSVELADLSLSSSSFKYIEDKQQNQRLQYIGSMTQFFIHLKLMFWKSRIIHQRSIKSTIFQMLSPFIVSFMLLCWQYLANDISHQKETEPLIREISPMEKCFHQKYSPLDCKTLLYAVIGEREPWMDFTINFIAQENNLDPQLDIAFLDLKDPADIMSYLQTHSNHTSIALLFCNGDWKISDNYSFPCYFEQNQDKKLILYSIIYNSTLSFDSFFGKDYEIALPKDSLATKLKISIDNGIAKYFSEKGTTPQLQMWTQDFPKTFFRFFINADMCNRLGAFHYFIPFMVILYYVFKKKQLLFVTTSVELLREKDKKLRQGLSVMGLAPAVYWANNIIISTLLVLCLTVSTIISGYMTQFPFFLDTSFWIIFSLFFLFGEAMQFLAFFISTISSSITIGYSVAYGILLFGLVMEFFIGYVFVVFLIYIKDPPLWYRFIRGIFQLYPAYSYSKIFGDITLQSGKHYDLKENRWIDGHGFNYSDLDLGHIGKFPITGIQFDVFILFIILTAGSSTTLIFLAFIIKYFNILVSNVVL